MLGFFLNSCSPSQKENRNWQIKEQFICALVEAMERIHLIKFASDFPKAEFILDYRRADYQISLKSHFIKNFRYVDFLYQFKMFQKSHLICLCFLLIHIFLHTCGSIQNSANNCPILYSVFMHSSFARTCHILFPIMYII